MLWVAVPFATFVLLARLRLTAGVGFGLVLDDVELALVGAVAYGLATRVLRLSRPSTGGLLVSTTLGNTGSLGVPLTGALLGTAALCPAIAWDGFAFGAGFGTGDGRRRVHMVTRNPPLLAAIAGFAAPDVLAPDVLVHVAHFVVFALLSAGFFVLGVHLARESSTAMTRLVTTAAGIAALAT